MTKNIVIFSDGTGQHGGVLFDERRSNIYKLYRASRCGPDSCVNPLEQVAYYDPGIGTTPGGLGFFGSIWRRLYNLASQATGLGLTLNIIDCYTAILKMYEPGDRIFLFGFSRGAYTVRCVAAVLALCGVPTKGFEGGRLLKDEKSLRRVARDAVKRVYQHVSSPHDVKYVGQRDALAKNFREKHGSSVAYPHFIGVFDTVAAVASLWLFALLSTLLVTVVGVLGWFVGGFTWMLGGWLTAAAIIGIAFLWMNIRYAKELTDIPFKRRFHLARPKMRFVDYQLNDNVKFARHALAIDEHRKSFDRVKWGASKQNHGNEWLKQIWFAGNHSDIGGSYIENESRLSDLVLQWMADEASNLPNGAGLRLDRTVLQTFGDPLGMQHDECMSGLFKYTSKINREIQASAPLHPSVHQRFSAKHVQHCNEYRDYRPASLREHAKTKHYY